MRHSVSSLILMALLVVAQPLVAHHSMTAPYDQSRIIIVMGKISKVEWVNPHAFIWIESTLATGKKVAWSPDIAAPNHLQKVGWTSQGALNLIGQTVTMRGYPSKDNNSTMVLPLSVTTDKGATLALDLNLKPENIRIENGVGFLITK
jgi:hypothetical protein